MLRDLASKLSVPVDMKFSEDILKIFFQGIIRSMSSEELVQFISGLPSYLKPFCYTTREFATEATLNFYNKNQKKVTEAVFNVFEGYLNEEICEMIRGKFYEVIRIDTPRKRVKSIAA